ncbi:hypothetical protein ACFXPW_30035 [Streptomyces goshikiensis]|uniref:hypothetical protein n=1 Tax=Streptomyces goshikiensis TaxID=1942 RepID=UPI003677EA0C
MAEERFTRRTVTVVMVVIAALAFVFSFSNVWALALRPAPGCCTCAGCSPSR